MRKATSAPAAGSTHAAAVAAQAACLEAIRASDLDEVRRILDHGLVVLNPLIAHGHSSHHHQRPLRQAARSDRNLDIARLLVERGADLHFRDDEGWTALSTAVGNNQLHMAALLLDLGAQINAQDDNGNTVLHLAVTKGNLDMVRLLLDHGADRNLQNKSQRTPEREACKNGTRPPISDLIRDYVPGLQREQVTDEKPTTTLSFSSAAASIAEAPPSYQSAIATPAEDKRADHKLTTTIPAFLQLVHEEPSRIDELQREVEALRGEVATLQAERRCGVCNDRRKNVAFQCGHQTCIECGQAIVECPVCHARVALRLSLYDNYR